MWQSTLWFWKKQMHREQRREKKKTNNIPEREKNLIRHYFHSFFLLFSTIFLFNSQDATWIAVDDIPYGISFMNVPLPVTLASNTNLQVEKNRKKLNWFRNCFFLFSLKANHQPIYCWWETKNTFLYFLP